MDLNPNKTQGMTVSRSQTLDPSQPDLHTNNVPVTTRDSFKILGYFL